MTKKQDAESVRDTVAGQGSGNGSPPMERTPPTPVRFQAVAGLVLRADHARIRDMRVRVESESRYDTVASSAMSSGILLTPAYRPRSFLVIEINRGDIVGPRSGCRTFQNRMAPAPGDLADDEPDAPCAMTGATSKQPVHSHNCT
jgi:hypothetical protein